MVIKFFSGCWLNFDLSPLVPSPVPWKCQPRHCPRPQKESGRRVTLEACGLREVLQGEAGTSCPTGKTQTSLSQCAMSRVPRQGWMSGSHCSRIAPTPTCSLSASTFTRSHYYNATDLLSTTCVTFILDISTNYYLLTLYLQKSSFHIYNFIC